MFFNPVKNLSNKLLNKSLSRSIKTELNKPSKASITRSNILKSIDSFSNKLFNHVKTLLPSIKPDIDILFKTSKQLLKEINFPSIVELNFSKMFSTIKIVSSSSFVISSCFNIPDNVSTIFLNPGRSTSPSIFSFKRSKTPSL